MDKLVIQTIIGEKRFCAIHLANKFPNADETWQSEGLKRAFIPHNVYLLRLYFHYFFCSF